MPRAALCSLCPIGRGPRIRAQSHKQQRKHTQPLDVIPHHEVSLPKLFSFVDQLANHQASVDRSPRGPSNPADVASAGQHQTLPGWTNAQKSTGTARRVWLFSPQTHKRPSICTASPFFAEFQLSIRGGSPSANFAVIASFAARIESLSHKVVFGREDYIHPGRSKMLQYCAGDVIAGRVIFSLHCYYNIVLSVRTSV